VLLKRIENRYGYIEEGKQKYKDRLWRGETAINGIRLKTALKQYGFYGCSPFSTNKIKTDILKKQKLKYEM
jgi:hypothetical protein